MTNVNSHALRLLGAIAAIVLPSVFCSAAPLSIQDKPIFVSNTVPPMVMLNLSKDHQLFMKAYTDYADLDDDGIADVTYKHSIDYYGYFDPYKCYTYSTASGYFSPVTVNAKDTTTADLAVRAANNQAAKYCSSASKQWSGNFLNWATMTRIDVVRKLLYGGKRSTDTASQTVVEREYVPPDSHAFVKYYQGTDINKLTPFTTTLAATTTTTSNTGVPIGVGDKALTVANLADLAPLTVGAQVKVSSTTTPTSYMIGYVKAINSGAKQITIKVTTSGAKGAIGTSYSSWKVENLSQIGISICNVTVGATDSQSSTKPPLMRVAKGNFSLWTANEHGQCYWREETTEVAQGVAAGTTSVGNFDPSSASSRSNGNIGSDSLIWANAFDPERATHALSPDVYGNGAYDQIVRVETCVAGFAAGERCGNYGTDASPNYKPIGLLQDYGTGTNPKIKFGLMTGSYEKNKSGGVLRRALGSMDPEIQSNGTFTSPYSGIIDSLNRLRIYGFDHANGNYKNHCDTYAYNTGTTSDNRNDFSEGNCSSWGDPLAEIYLESIRYLAGKTSATTGFSNSASHAKEAALGLGATPSAWTDPLNADNYCAPLNVVQFNSTVATFDADQLVSVAATLDGSPNPIALTNTIGGATYEGIAGSSYFVGDAEGSNTKTCNAKLVNNFGTALGICPESPAGGGSYNVSGLSWWAHTNRIRSGPVTLPTNDTHSYKVTTYGITLATNSPNIRIALPNGKELKLLPAFRPEVTVSNPQYGTGQLVDFKISPDSLVYTTGPDSKAYLTEGKYVAVYDVSQQGADYDSDAWGYIRFKVGAADPNDSTKWILDWTKVTVWTDIIATAASGKMGFGYVLSGSTNQDGTHFHSGKDNFSYTYSNSATGANTQECNSCNTSETETSKTYTAGSGSALLLKDPLWYASKWGGFVDTNNNGKIAAQSQWDSKKNDGTPGTDGTPDTYFFVANPGALEKSLETAFIEIINSSSASAVATNSSSLKTGTNIYQAKFNPLNWTGNFVAFSIDPTTFALTELWNAANCLQNDKVPASGDCSSVKIGTNDRFIATYKPSDRTGIPFKFSSLDSSQVALLKQMAGETDPVTESRLNYLRGSDANEGAATNNFRPRPVTKLGDIVNSNPFYVGIPAGQYVEESLYFQAYSSPSYTAFRNGLLTRKPILYVGANDGMLHGFDAETGVEKMAYVPNTVFSNLKDLASSGYQHKFFVDGSPVVADAKFSTGWKTVLVDTLQSGGRGIFALDVTNPDDFTDAKVDQLSLWEFSDANDADLGLTYSTPLIVKLNNGKWAAVIGNGYNNTGSGSAKLFIFLLEEGASSAWVQGTNYFKIDTGVGNLTGNENGLSSPAAMDYNGDGIVDFVYAGDLKGNLWKFDLTSTDPADWDVATLKTQGAATSAKQPLFVSCSDNTIPCPAAKRQPITTRPAVSFHSMDLNSLMIYFGTGKYLETTDSNTTQTQTVYGIEEKITQDNSGNPVYETVARTSLKPATITNVTTCTGKNADGTANTYACSVRTVTKASVDWSTDKGWYESLPDTGERVIAAVQLMNGIVIYNTMIPSTSPCKFGGTGFLMGVQSENGGQINDYALFDTDKNGTFSSVDMPAGGISIGASLGGTTVIKPNMTTGVGAGVSNPSDDTGKNKDKPIVDALSGRAFAGARISWRELINE